MTPRDLAQFRARVPQCELAVYADIGSRTVLSSDGALRYPQEYLDALCECAALLYRGDLQFGGHVLDPILFFGPTGGRAFFRAPSDPREALCCICAPSTDVTVLIAGARAAMGAGAAP